MELIRPAAIPVEGVWLQTRIAVDKDLPYARLQEMIQEVKDFEKNLEALSEDLNKKETPLSQEAEDNAGRLLRGTWELVRLSHDGTEMNSKAEYKRLAFDGQTVRISWKLTDPKGAKEEERNLRFTVNPTRTPAELMAYGDNFLMQAVYRLNGDRLEVATFGRPEVGRPRGFAADAKQPNSSPLIVETYVRMK